MPLYEYRCSACSESFSLLQKMGTGVAETSCPKCGSPEVEKLISACSVSSGSVGSHASGPACSIGGG